MVTGAGFDAFSTTLHLVNQGRSVIAVKGNSLTQQSRDLSIPRIFTLRRPHQKNSKTLQREIPQCLVGALLAKRSEASFCIDRQEFSLV